MRSSSVHTAKRVRKSHRTPAASFRSRRSWPIACAIMLHDPKQQKSAAAASARLDQDAEAPLRRARAGRNADRNIPARQRNTISFATRSKAVSGPTDTRHVARHAAPRTASARHPIGFLASEYADGGLGRSSRWATSISLQPLRRRHARRRSRRAGSARSDVDENQPSPSAPIIAGMIDRNVPGAERGRPSRQVTFSVRSHLRRAQTIRARSYPDAGRVRRRRRRLSRYQAPRCVAPPHQGQASSTAICDHVSPFAAPVMLEIGPGWRCAGGGG